MRKLYVILLLALAACSEGVFVDNQDIPVAQDRELIVGFEQADTRIGLIDDKCVWTKGDSVTLFYDSGETEKWVYVGETGERVGRLRAADQNSIADGTMSAMIYPYREDYLYNTNRKNCKVNIPTTQNYADRSFGLDGALMTATIEEGTTTMRNALGWLRLHVTGNGETVSSIKIRGNRGEQLAGQGTVKMSDASLTLDANDAALPNEVVLLCPDGVKLSAEERLFYIALPPQTLEKGITVEITCSNGKIMTKRGSNPVPIERNTISPMVAFNFKADVVESIPAGFRHRVLLIDHTGMSCQYCPKMIDALLLLKSSEYGENYSEVTCHGGSFARYGDPAYSEAAQVVDTYYMNLFSLSYPTLTANYAYGAYKVSSTANNFVNSTMDYVLKNMLQREGADAGISISNRVVSEKIDIDVEVWSASTQDYKVAVWVLENNISSPNQKGATLPEHKVYNHALRYIATHYTSSDISGDPLGTIANKRKAYRNFEVVLDNTWARENLEILVIVSSPDELGNYEVVNTAVAPINGTVGYEYVD